MIILYINRLHVCHIILLIEMNANEIDNFYKYFSV